MKQDVQRMRRFPARAEHSRAFSLTRPAAWLRGIGYGAAALAIASLGACASSNDASLINLPDGQTGYAVNCSGADARTSWASCYVLAGKKCGATGYDIVSKDNEEGGPTGGGITNVVSANVKNRSMIVRCK
ncbi:putative Lipoprotein [Candidatus Paraburkholderia calva]|nr:putative Lipoprotein [Candidatus Paraburkholderia calva]